MPTPTPADQTHPPELLHVLERAARGDESALPALRQAFDDHPEPARPWMCKEDGCWCAAINGRQERHSLDCSEAQGL